MKQYLYTALIVLGLASTVVARENVNTGRYGAPTGGNVMLSGCAPSKSRADLDVNNVRCPIWINGDMWWDLSSQALYEIPVNSGKHSLFAGAIWIGGQDQASQLRVAAQTYRQSGSDFWPGPVDNTTSVTPDVCLKYDKHYKITFAEVKNFHENYQVNGDLSYPIPASVKNWPGNNTDPGYEFVLAPFHDESNDGVYDYNDGDYPKYNVDGTQDQCDKSLLLGDQTIWWVFNDVGNIHNETGSVNPVGVEIQAQAFGFNTNNEINNMTFYRYKIINRASTSLNQTYFGSWVDPDLGNYLDDYVGCDVARGLGYCYNGDANDEGALGYGLNPPAVGMDFFEGPLADSADGINNDRDNDTDEVGEQIIMSKFVYYNNDFTNIGNPVTANHYYNYLRGIWKDGSPLVYGGTGYQTTAPGGAPCDFMFPGDSDPNWIGTGGAPQTFLWTERTPKPSDPANEPSDRRFLQSAGAFTLQPGAVNYITTGVVWARATSGGPDQSVKLLKLADVVAQNLFESCFKVSNGPDAPVVNIRELDRELILSISNPPSSNNYRELYEEDDINIPGSPLAKFKFEGYKIYQVKDPSVSVNDLDNADKARLIFQCDIKNGVSQIVNSVYDGGLSAFVPTEKVAGADNGLKHAIKINTDAFATGDAVLVNHKSYYFMAIAYAFDSLANQAGDFQGPPPGIYGQPYIQSRKNADGAAISIYSAIPHIPAPEANGLEITSYFGDGPEITRVTGMGNGYNLGADRLTTEIKQDQIDQIIFNSSSPSNKIGRLTYARAQGPVDIRIYDPVKVPPGNFELWLTDTVANAAKWILHNTTSDRYDTAEKTLEAPYEQLFTDYGFYISMNQVVEIGQSTSQGNGFISATSTYADPNSRWLSGIGDNDNGFGQKFDWILAGSDGANVAGADDYKFYQGVLGGTWAPFKLANQDSSGSRVAPAPNYTPGPARSYDKMEWINSVDIVFTADKSKWSKCVVFEMQNTRSLAEGSQFKNLIRKAPSLDINGNPTSVDSGYSYFPGYAINVETGERLNIAFGEDSRLSSENGNDMKWNPTPNVFAADGSLIAGGKHYIYVFGNKAGYNDTLTGSESAVGGTILPSDTSYWGPAYDGCQHIHHTLWNISSVSTTANKQKINKVWKDCMWVGVPLQTPGQSLLNNDLKIRIRVAKPYRKYDSGVPSPVANNDFPYYNFSTNDLIAKVNQVSVAKTALDLINVVPNPYYAYCNYEANQLDNRIKITNLPNKCTVSIYTTSGTLIRQFKRDVGFDNTAGTTTKEVNLETALEWDLKNSLNIPVASGMYLIHVQADGIGERTLKWFGVMRPVDLDTF